jgi:methyltransferase (TIGR00027 family)
MQSDLPSQTAEYTAMHRAAHQLLDVPPVFRDPIAMLVIDPAVASALLANPEPVCATLPLSPFRRAFLAVRSRYAEDRLARAVAAGCAQYVILGAGFDTFSFRCPHPYLRIWEIDHPASQARKVARFRDAGLTVPSFVRFVAADFECQTIEEILEAAHVELGQPTFFSWLGVTQYLKRDAILATLRHVASMPRGTEIVFDYVLWPDLRNAAQRSIVDTWAPQARAAGEPFCSAFEPADMAALCASFGFTHAEDLGTEDMNVRYCSGRCDGLKIESICRLFSARV